MYIHRINTIDQGSGKKYEKEKHDLKKIPFDLSFLLPAREFCKYSNFSFNDDICSIIFLVFFCYFHLAKNLQYLPLCSFLMALPDLISCEKVRTHLTLPHSIYNSFESNAAGWFLLSFSNTSVAFEASIFISFTVIPD